MLKREFEGSGSCEEKKQGFECALRNEMEEFSAHEGACDYERAKGGIQQK